MDAFDTGRSNTLRPVFGYITDFTEPHRRTG